MTGDYFDTEMRLLQEAAQEFARAYPEKAGMLNLHEVKDRDPYVERLLEGMAFLTAQVRQRIDDDVPEIAEALLAHLRPHFLRPFPAATIMQFTPRQGLVQPGTAIAAGTLLASAPVAPARQAGAEAEERVSCRFRTTSEVVLQPLRLSRVAVEEAGHGGGLLRLDFQLDAGMTADRLGLERLKLHLHGDAGVTSGLYHALCAQVEQVRLQVADVGRHRPQRLGGQEVVLPCHLGAEELLTPSSGRSFLGFQLLQEYFAFREKFLFVSLERLEQVTWPRDVSEFSVEILFRTPLPPEFRLGRDHFRLHCAPAVNLYPATAEPIRLDHRRHEYPLVANAAIRRGEQVYSVEQVTGIHLGSGRRTGYVPLPAFDHGDRKARYFHVAYRGGDERLTTGALLSVGGALGSDGESLSCDITAFNGDLPRQCLQINGIQAPAQAVPAQVQCGNILRPSRMLRPPRRADYHLSLVTHLALNYQGLESVESLRKLLRLYDWSEQPQNRKRIDGILAIETRPADRVCRGGLLRGLEIRLRLKEAEYLSVGDAWLFGTVLHRFLSMYAAINTFVATTVILEPSMQELTWEPLLGVNFPL